MKNHGAAILSVWKLKCFAIVPKHLLAKYIAVEDVETLVRVLKKQRN